MDYITFKKIMNLQEKHGWIGLHLQYPIQQVELNVSLTTLAR